MKTRMIQIRHGPEDVHRRLKQRARREGLSDYLRRELVLLTQKLTWEELFAEIAVTVPSSAGRSTRWR